MCEAFVTMPFEVTKNRMQIEAASRAGILGSMASTYRTHGVTGLFYGLQPQLAQVAGKTAIRFAAFEQWKTVLPAGSNFTAGLLAGLTEALLWVTPTERLKVLRQAELTGASGTGGSASIFRAGAHVLRQQGLAGLWLGAAPTAARQAIANGTRFLLFDKIKQALDGIPAQAALAGGLAGVISTVLTNPVDVIKTHIQAMPVKGASAAGPTAIVRHLIQEQGVLPFFGAGLGARLLKIGLGQAVTFSAFEAVRRRVP